MAKRIKVDRVERVETSFCVCPIIDKYFNNGPLILMVHNIADFVFHGYEGKYAAWGFPGGGVTPERADTKESAAREETKGETGLTVQKLVHLFTDGKFIISELKTKRLLRQFFFEIGKRPSHRIDAKREIAIENPVHIFLARVLWEKSALKKLLMKKMRELIKNGEFTREGARTEGMSVFFEELSQKEIDSLGIYEMNEIDGIGIFPIPLLMDELARETGLPQNQRTFYWTHLNWLKRVLAQISSDDTGVLARRR